MGHLVFTGSMSVFDKRVFQAYPKHTRRIVANRSSLSVRIPFGSKDRISPYGPTNYPAVLAGGRRRLGLDPSTRGLAGQSGRLLAGQLHRRCAVARRRASSWRRQVTFVCYAMANCCTQTYRAKGYSEYSRMRGKKESVRTRPTKSLWRHSSDSLR